MVAGSAALLLQADPGTHAARDQGALDELAETNIFTNPATLPGVLAPITRIGAGEVRVDNAAGLKTAAWDAGERHAAACRSATRL